MAGPGERIATDPTFAHWLGGRLGAPGAVPVSFAGTPAGGGWSNETIFLDVAASGDAEARRLVMKMAPVGLSMFRVYDLSREHRCLKALEGGWPPVPQVVGEDWSGTLVGRPFYVMERVEGQVPADDKPSFMEAGFLFNAPAMVQRAVHDEMLRALAALQSRNPQDLGLGSLGRDAEGETPLARELAWLHDLFLWGSSAAPQPVITQAFERAFATLPAIADGALSWGDARPANAVFRDFRLVALLDWELATLGPRELDLFWFLEMNAMRARGRPLPGFPGEAEAVAQYEAMAGVHIREPAWFRHFSALKVAVLMLRHLLQRVDAGLLAADHAVLTDNVALRRLKAL
jgi:aminoglycoside phosphotransferase (APT) family kinase protein